MTNIREISGIGPATAEKLEAANIETAEQLSIMAPEELAAILVCSVAKAKKLIKAAKDLTKEAIQLFNADTIYQERLSKVQRISTGSYELDKILGGGVPTDALTALFGRFASGKTQISKQLVVNIKKQYNRKAAWIETEPQSFIPERIMEIAEANNVEYSLKDDLFIIPAELIDTPTHLFKAYEVIETKIKQGLDIGLIVIDSFNAPFRSTYTGREMLPGRSSDQGRHIGYLQRIASKYNVAIVLTLQVMGVPDDKAQLGAKKRFGIKNVPVVSHVVKHGVNYLIGLEIISSVDKTRSAIIADGPVPRAECMFVIDSTGISDYTKRAGVR